MHGDLCIPASQPTHIHTSLRPLLLTPPLSLASCWTWPDSAQASVTWEKTYPFESLDKCVLLSAFWEVSLLQSRFQIGNSERLKRFSIKRNIFVRHFAPSACLNSVATAAARRHSSGVSGSARLVRTILLPKCFFCINTTNIVIQQQIKQTIFYLQKNVFVFSEQEYKTDNQCSVKNKED